MSQNVQPAMLASRVRSGLRRKVLLLLGTFLVVLVSNVAAAQARGEYITLFAYNTVTSTSHGHGTLASIRRSTTTTASPTFTPGADSPFAPHPISPAEPFSLAVSEENSSSERYYSELERRPGTGLLEQGSIALFRARVPSRYSYQSWAGLHYGYGQLFASPDLIGRSRTSGAGIDDPSCLYMKVSFNF